MNSLNILEEEEKEANEHICVPQFRKLLRTCISIYIYMYMHMHTCSYTYIFVLFALEWFEFGSEVTTASGLTALIALWKDT